MQEHEWLTSTDPAAMLDRITKHSDMLTSFAPFKLKVSDRKLRLFAESIEPMLGNTSYDEVDNWTEELQVFLQPSIVLEVSDPAKQAALLREIVGNPWRPVTLPVATEAWQQMVAPSSGTSTITQIGVRKTTCPWHTPPVLSLARYAYEERDFSGLPVLADALEEAGCVSEDLLRHLRGREHIPMMSGNVLQANFDGALRGPHVRGCWALDVLLGKD